MLAVAFLLLVFPTVYNPVQDNAELDKIARQVNEAWSKNCAYAKKLSGTIRYKHEYKNAIYGTDSTKWVIKDDGVNHITIEYFNENDFLNASILRSIGNVKQGLFINKYGKNQLLKKPIIQSEAYSNVSHHAKYFENNPDDRTIMTRGMTSPFCRPTHSYVHSLLDLFDSPAFKLSGIRKYTEGKIDFVQIDYSIDQSINGKQSIWERVSPKEGTVTLRPDLDWVITKSDYVLVRKWHSDYSYEIKPNGFPVIKAIKSKTIDDNPEKNLLPLEYSAEYQLEILNTPLTAEDLSLKQFGLDERMPEDYQRDIQLQKEAALKMQDNSAPTPPGGFPIAAQPYALSPWIILVFACAFLLLVGLFLVRKARKTTPS